MCVQTGLNTKKKKLRSYNRVQYYLIDFYIQRMIYESRFYLENYDHNNYLHKHTENILQQIKDYLVISK